MKKILLNTLLSATLLLGTVNNISYAMETENNCIKYTTSEKQHIIRQQLENEYKDELNEWDENFKNSLNQLNEELISIAEKIDNLIEEEKITIDEKKYRNIQNKIQDFNIYQTFMQKIEKLIISDQISKLGKQVIYSNTIFNNSIQSTTKYLNNINDQINNIKINDIETQYKKISNETSILANQFTEQNLKESIFNEILKEKHEKHINSLEGYEEQIKEYCSKLVYILPQVAISQYESNIKNWVFNQGNI